MSKFEMVKIRDANGGTWGSWCAGRIDPAKIDVSHVIGFSDKAEYLVWVASWKEVLAKTVAEIREAKAEGRRSSREFLRVQASNLIVVRCHAKRVAAAQWLAWREGRAAA